MFFCRFFVVFAVLLAPVFACAHGAHKAFAKIGYHCSQKQDSSVLAIELRIEVADAAQVFSAKKGLADSLSSYLPKHWFVFGKYPSAVAIRRESNQFIARINFVTPRVPSLTLSSDMFFRNFEHFVVFCTVEGSAQPSILSSTSYTCHVPIVCP